MRDAPRVLQRYRVCEEILLHLYPKRQGAFDKHRRHIPRDGQIRSYSRVLQNTSHARLRRPKAQKRSEEGPVPCLACTQVAEADTAPALECGSRITMEQIWAEEHVLSIPKCVLVPRRLQAVGGMLQAKQAAANVLPTSWIVCQGPASFTQKVPEASFRKVFVPKVCGSASKSTAEF